MNIDRLSPETPAAQALIAEFGEYMAALYPPQRDLAQSIRLLQLPDVRFFGASVGDKLVGCGAVKLLEDDGTYAEIKSVFVAREHRGNGFSRPIMQQLEKYLSEIGICVARLATGTRQPEALALYASLGYVQRQPFGHYSADPLTIYMEKRLDTRS